MNPTYTLTQSIIHTSFWISIVTYLHYREQITTMLMDDYGNLVPVNFAALAVSVAN